MDRGPTSRVVGEMQIKTRRLRYTLIKTLTTPSAGRGAMGAHSLLVGTLGTSVTNILLPYGPALALLGIYPKDRPSPHHQGGRG